MSLPTQLQGGTLVTRDPNRKVAPYAEPPFMRLTGSLDLYLSTSCIVLFRKASLLNLGSPDTPWAEVAVREVDGTKYILVVPTDDKNPNRIPLTRPHANTGLIRTADDVLLDSGITMVPGFTYRMAAALTEDETYKHAVIVSWTHADQETSG